MKKNLLLRLGSISLAAVMLFAAGCGKPAAPTPTPTPTPTTAQSTQPVKGGTIKVITNAGPQNIGYFPGMGPTDSGAVFPALENIMEYTLDHKLSPWLAKSVVEDPDKLTFTITLNPGIMFTDGTELTAEVAAWNYQLFKDTKKLSNSASVKSIEVKDKYTLVLNLTNWNNQMIQDYGWIPMFSKDAYEKNGGKDWALTHLVATGPFKLDNFQRDVSISWVKNDNYWKKDKQPYLDGIQVKFIPDATTANAMMQAGEADIWQNSEAKDQSELSKKGFIRQDSWVGMQYHLMPSTTDPKSKWNDVRLRQAVEYALDKPAIAKAIGYGFYVPMNNVSPPGQWGEVTTPVRPYDPAKAKQLLADAGYPNGVKISLLAPIQTGGINVGAMAVKGYLDAVGFQTTIDIADPGRFYGSVFGKGWTDLAWMFSGEDVNYLVSASRWWSQNAKTNLGSFARPQTLKDAFTAAWSLKTEAEQKPATEKIVKVMSDEALMIPVYHAPTALILRKGVHTTYPGFGLVYWDWATTWMEKK